MNLKVAVRVRPFNTREKENNSTCCIEMSSNQTTITDELSQPRTFTFDYSFWSHDHYIEQENGYLLPDDTGKYSDQNFVFNSLGKQILDNAWEGYHCCLFAYGQTGSGKSYSMVGYGANKGIVPISCEEIFNRINNNKNENLHYEVEISMLEIYNEKVQDLLVNISKRPSTGLKIRESKTLGVFVSDLTKYPVSSYEEINNKMEEGYQNRTIGSTLMNNTSSRAHTIVTIEFKQMQTINNTQSAKLSKINLVDLAGSERANSTGATGARLKEGCNINKSLLVLGNVINTLADKAIGKKQNVLPPYRDSALTRILQNALGGNSKTVMICALSPASINYEETLSTLRYADRAKKIQNKAVVNESEHDKVVRLLKEENDELKRKIEELSKKLMGGVVEERDKSDFLELKAQYEQTQKLCDDMTKSFSEKLEEAKKAEKMLNIEKVDISKPHLVVLNEDPQLSHKLKYSLQSLPIYVGRKHGNPPPKIVLSGIGIKQNHAIFCENEGKIVLKPNESDAIKHIFINGRKIESPDGQILKNKDRIIFGMNTIMLFMEHSDNKDIYEIDWESAQTEMQRELEEQSKIQELENEQKKQEAYNTLKKSLENKYNKDKEEIETKMKMQLIEYENKLKEMKDENESKLKIEKQRDELESRLKKKIEQLEENKKNQGNNKYYEGLHKNNIDEEEDLEKKLIKIVKKIFKLKKILSDMKRNIEVDLFLTKNILYLNNENTPSTNDHLKNLNIYIKVLNYEQGDVYYWTPGIFHTRYDSMKELYQKFLLENLDISNIQKEKDPLLDNPNHFLLGYAFYKLVPMAYLMSNCVTVPIISVNGNIQGNITINIVPITKNFREFSKIPQDPMDLIGKNIKYYIHIKECADLPENFCKGIQVEFISFSDEMVYKTKIYNENGESSSFEINEKFQNEITYITEEDINFLLKNKLCFKIYAYEVLPKKDPIGIPNREEIINELEVDEIDFKKELAKMESKSKGSGSSIGEDIIVETRQSVKKGKKNDKDCLIF